ncbi:MAG: hypothetical protein HY979_03205 [Candidatus Magasanikbacteria bacterium]|nr:hypothetical protein [Candidatus Magasanikbacteria bacterium]
MLQRSLPWFKQAEYYKNEELRFKNEEWTAKVIGLERERVTTLAELPEAVKFVFTLPEYQKELLVWRKGTLEEVKKILPEIKKYLDTFSVQEWTKAQLEQRIGEWMKQKGYSAGSVLWPLRVSLSGQQNSPGPYEIAEVLGKEETLNRLKITLQKLG